VPLPADAAELGRARAGEGTRPWSAHAGAASMAAGLVQAPWILRSLRAHATDAPAFTDWGAFAAHGEGLFVWEAFVTAAAKGATHEDDAGIGARAFCDALPDPTRHNACPTNGEVLSLIGAALIRTGWVPDEGALWRPCLVIRAIPAEAPGAITAAGSGSRRGSRASPSG
jgi:hypothetical protein